MRCFRLLSSARSISSSRRRTRGNCPAQGRDRRIARSDIAASQGRSVWHSMPCTRWSALRKREIDSFRRRRVHRSCIDGYRCRCICFPNRFVPSGKVAARSNRCSRASAPCKPGPDCRSKPYLLWCTGSGKHRRTSRLRMIVRLDRFGGRTTRCSCSVVWRMFALARRNRLFPR